MIKSYNKNYCDNFFENIRPIKLTESRCLKLNTVSWGILTDYNLESVKVNSYESGQIISAATLRVVDKSGHVTCVIKGSSIGLLFGLTKEKWMAVERLSKQGGSLFYRYFKNGLKEDFSVEQKLFYYFCNTNQTKDVLVAKYRRCMNTRKLNKTDALISILELQKCSDNTLVLYQDYIRMKSNLS